VRLLFVTGSLVHGGAERHAITLANRLAERGHGCHAAYVKNDPSQLERLKLGAGGSVQCMHAAKYLDLDALFRLKNLFLKTRPSVVFAANQYALMYATLAGRWAGSRAPLAVAYHSTKLQGAKEFLQMLAYRPLFWAADCAVFVCENQRRHWRKRQVFGRRDMVIHNGVDTEHWQPAGDAERRQVRGALGLAEDDYVVGLSAVLRPEKNPLQLVDAIAMLRRRASGRGARARALLIGDGPMRAAVEERARRLGVSRDVLVTGLQSDVRPFVAACDTVVLTSFTEAFSLAAIEAMALGKPVVHSEVGGAAEMIRPGRNGFLFPVGDTGALVERLAALSDRAMCERMGARAREVVETRFSEREMVDRYEKLLMELETTRIRHENLRRAAGAH
jgi:glycosyltransferase involved in cell wall biosynthesis